MPLSKKITSWVLFILVFITECVAGYYVCHIKSFIDGDALSRVANAYYVLYIRPSHLAAIGAVWTPLLSFLEMPLLLLTPIYKPIASSGLASVFVTSSFAAGSGVLIFKYTVDYGRSQWTGLCLALLYCFNPFMFLYGCNGMTEVPYCFMLLWFTYNFTQWMENENPDHIIKMACALMLSFLIRYEAITASISAFLAFTIIILTFHRKNLEDERRKDLKYSLQCLEGKSLVLLTPVVYAFLVWMIYCWVIMGNPLYFLNSNYSNLGFVKLYSLNPVLKGMIGKPVLVIKYIVSATVFFMLPLMVVIIYRIIRRTIFKPDFFVLILFVLSANILQFVMLSKGASIGIFRYFIYPLPFLMAWFPYEMKKNKTKVFTFFCIIIMIIADISLGFSWLRSPVPAMAGEKFRNFKFVNYPSEIAQRKVVQYINEKIPHAKIMMDAFLTVTTIINCNNPQHLVITSSYEFKRAIKNPKLYKIDYILVPSTITTDPTSMDAFNRYYPNLYIHGADWCVLEKEFDKGYKLYRIKK
ncbi:MAG TPA: hypothetical protein DDW50_14680 [Firmicutes bacterium]|jgi:hypothetical protein|nr:hypothetical protein [Bacillota bacterium]